MASNGDEWRMAKPKALSSCDFWVQSKQKRAAIGVEMLSSSSSSQAVPYRIVTDIVAKQNGISGEVFRLKLANENAPHLGTSANRIYASTRVILRCPEPGKRAGDLLHGVDCVAPACLSFRENAVIYALKRPLRTSHAVAAHFAGCDRI